MMKLSKALMLSVSGLIFTSNGSAASMYDSTSFNSPDAITFVHTHTSHPEEILLSSPDLSFPGQPLIFLRHGNDLSQRMEEIKTAATCFVTDTSACSGNEFSGNNADDDGHGAPGGPGDGDDDYDLDNEERCRQEGYTQTSCPAGYDKVNYCPYDNSYFEKCQEPCPDYFVECEPPYYGVGTACGNKYASCEKDTERACKEQNPDYVTSCPPGQQFSSDRCSYDSSYGICCNTCAGYPYTADTIPDGYVQDGEACTDCNGQTKYKIKPNPCDGYLDCGSMGPETGANSCLSGTMTKYDNCKPCPNLGTLSSCPAGYKCKFEDCSGKYYKVDGCQSGYDWNASNKTCTEHCDYKCNLSSCPANAECDYESCSKKYCFKYCSGNYEEINGKCSCPADYNLSSCPANASCSSCGGKYSFNGCKSTAYKDTDGTCKLKGTCARGSIFYSDGSCDILACFDKYVSMGKTVVGVVVAIEYSGNVIVMAPDQINNVSWGTTNDFYSEDIFLQDSNCLQHKDYGSGTSVCGKSGIYEISAGSDFCSHRFADSNLSPAATEAENYGSGWFLPSSEILLNIPCCQEDINQALEAIGGQPLSSGDIWSSDLYHQKGKAGALAYNNGSLYVRDMTATAAVRPVKIFERDAEKSNISTSCYINFKCYL